MNVLVAAVTKLPPIKVAQRKQHKEAVPQQQVRGRGGGAETLPKPGAEPLNPALFPLPR